MSGDFEAVGKNPDALFTLKLHRGDGMVLLGMNWKGGPPPEDFVGFAVEFKEPGGNRFLSVRNRLAFDDPGSSGTSSLRSPIQKFRWVHFPFNAEQQGEFTYRVTPVFMDEQDELAYGSAQEARVELARETYPGKLNVAFTRGFVSSQAFVDRYANDGKVSTLLPTGRAKPLTFSPSHPDAAEALAWMGFEARSALLEVLDQAITHNTAQVKVVAYDLNQPEIFDRLERLGTRLTIIIDNSGAHGESDSPETRAAELLAVSAGAGQVKRQKMGGLQHNKTIVVSGGRLQRVVCGSTNFTWRGLYVQNNNALVLTGKSAVAPFLEAFDSYWASDKKSDFGDSTAAQWADLGLDSIDAHVAFSPHSSDTALLTSIADDINDHATSSIFYSLAFLYQTLGPIRTAIRKATRDDDLFVYGISDKKVGGLDLQKPSRNPEPVSPAALGKDVPEPFKSEPTGGAGNRLHHKFIVIDFDKPTARLYTGSYNFSKAADTSNGENLLLIKDRRVAVSYVVEAVRIFDHYEFRLKQAAAATARKRLRLQRPPRAPGESAWWEEDYSVPQKIRDRKLFA